MFVLSVRFSGLDLAGRYSCSLCLAVVTYLLFVRRIRGFVAKIDECRGRYDVPYSDGCRWFLSLAWLQGLCDCVCFVPYQARLSRMSLGVESWIFADSVVSIGRESS